MDRSYSEQENNPIEVIFKKKGNDGIIEYFRKLIKEENYPMIKKHLPYAKEYLHESERLLPALVKVDNFEIFGLFLEQEEWNQNIVFWNMILHGSKYIRRYYAYELERERKS